MSKDLIVVGAGNVGGFIVNNLKEFKHDFKVVGFLDDDESKLNKEFWGLKVLGKVEDINKYKGISVVLGIASPKVKRDIVKNIIPQDTNFPSFVSKHAWLAPDVKVGRGSIIYPGTCINYSSIIEDFVVINMNCALGHHSTISSYSALAPGVNFAGYTFLEEAVDMGIGAATIQNIRVGKGSVVGGQCMIIDDVAPGSKIVGVPGKNIGVKLRK